METKFGMFMPLDVGCPVNIGSQRSLPVIAAIRTPDMHGELPSRHLLLAQDDSEQSGPLFSLWIAHDEYGEWDYELQRGHHGLPFILALSDFRDMAASMIEGLPEPEKVRVAVRFAEQPDVSPGYAQTQPIDIRQ